MTDHSPYTIVETLSLHPGTGLYRAVRNADHLAVVLKVLDPRQTDPQALERLKREYKIGKTLDAAAVVKPLALEAYEGKSTLAMEDYGGRPLDRLLGAPLDAERFLDLAVRIAGAAAAIHRQGIVHKDLKPENILVHPITGEVKITNFGLASRLPREPQPARPPRLVEGSLPYLSPEQTGRMNRAVDSRADLYSLGVIFYRMLTGRFPFEADDPLEWIYCHIARAPPSPSEIAPAVPEQLARIVDKLLAKMAEDRYQTARGLRHDLERCRVDCEPFALGERDVSDRLRLPQKLYGREAELADVLGTFERVRAGGTPELLLVSGYAGIGKSSLVRELSGPVTRARGIFISGKFDQGARDIPYSTIVHAFKQMVLELLAEPEERGRVWRDDLRRALGVNAKLIADVIPPLELLIGAQPPPPAIALTDEKQRFRRVFVDFVAVFARAHRPLVLFLDDLQWADASSLRLIEDIITDPATRNLLLVGAWRDAEVTAGHPLLSTLERIRGTPAAVSRVVLRPLGLEALVALVADAVFATAERARPLAALVHAKTGGNPFFALQFLTTLHDEQVLWLDEASLSWQWDLARIQALGYTDNVVDFMVRRLGGLPAAAQAVLQIAACIGNQGPLALLSLVYGASEEQTLADLWDALDEGLILLANGGYMFAHDRVQQAAYSLIADERRPERHLAIGRLLLAHTPREQLGERIFDVVTQLDLGAPLIAGRDERTRLAALNLAAARKAQAAAAYPSAEKYLSAGMALLAADSWEAEHELTYGLHLERARCEWLSGRSEIAAQLVDLLLLHARGRVEQAEIYLLAIDLHTSRGEIEDSVRTTLAAASKLFGLELELHPSEERLRRMVAQTRRQLGARAIGELARLPAMTDSETKAEVALLSAALAPAYFTDPKLHDLMCCHIVSLSVRHGNSEFSPHGYVTFGAALGKLFDQWSEAYQFGRLAQDLVERRGPGAGRGRASTYFTIGFFLSFWIKPLREVTQDFHRAFQAAIEEGDLNDASYAAHQIVHCRLLAGEPLEDVAAEAEAKIEFARGARNYVLYALLLDHYRLIQRLRGVPLNAPAQAAATLTGPQKVVHPVADFARRASTALGAFIFGAYDQAIEAAVDADGSFHSVRTGHLPLSDLRYLAALAVAARLDGAPAKERPWMRRLLAAEREELRNLQKHCPSTFLHRYALVCAEMARLEGGDAEAMHAYEQAIVGAERNGFIQHQAIACEAAARFYRSRDLDSVADLLLQRARDCYLRWGARAKAEQLEQLHPFLREPGPFQPTATFAVRPEQLDLMSVIKAAQAISSEIVLDRLARTLLEAVLVQSGAQRAVLILRRDGELLIEAQAALEQRGVVTSLEPPAPAAGSPFLPASLLRYVELTKERVILDEAARETGRFAADEYFARARPRSVLCAPILQQVEVVGLLYLENRLVAGAFTPDRLAALELLAAQAAISLENAVLLARERTARKTAEDAERRATLLAEAGARLSESVEYEERLSGLVRLCVGWLADWCVIDLVEDGQIHRAAGAHADPAKERELKEVQQRYPASRSSRHPAASVLRTGEPLLLPEMTDDIQRSMTEDAEHARLVRVLGTRSGLIVPLHARGQILGALSLASSVMGRYGRADLELAQELAGRAAIAIDNARLYRTSQEAVQLRDEFLSVASHELHTPMTSLTLSLQAVKELLPATLADPTVGRMVELALRQGERLKKLVADLLDTTRIQRGELHLERAPVELGELVREVIARFKMNLQRARCEVSVECRAPAVGLWDRSRLDQVITNLLSNAIKFGAGRPIEIWVDAEGRVGRFAISDHGIGIDPVRRERLFERFGRGVPAEHYGGLGLGLYICRKIVEAHGGSIAVQSRAGEGATFTVELPP